MTDVVTRWPFLWRVFRGPLAWRFDQLAPHWDSIRKADSLDPLAAALDTVTPPRRALDLGTGTGAAATLLARRFPHAEIVGVDLSAAMVEQARRNLPVELSSRVTFAQADAARLPFPDAAFELVALVNMIPFWDELARVVAPGGALVVAFSAGPGTPIYVPEERLRAQFDRRGFSQFANFRAGRGAAFLARRDTAR